MKEKTMKFGPFASILSVLSLFSFSAVIVWCLIKLNDEYNHVDNNCLSGRSFVWVVALYYYSLYASILPGGCYEAFLILTRRPYELDSYPKIVCLRSWNVAIVVSLQTFFVVGMVVGGSEEAERAMNISMYVLIAICHILGPARWHQGDDPKAWGTQGVVILTVLQILLLAIFQSNYGGWYTTGAIILTNLLNIAAVSIFGNSTPLKNVCFHVAAASGQIFLTYGIIRALEVEPCFPALVGDNLHFPWLYFLATFVVGGVVVSKIEKGKKKESYEIIS